MDERRRRLGPLEIIAIVVLAFTLLTALAIVAPIIVPGSDAAELVFRVTWGLISASGGIAGRALIIAAILSVAVLVRAAVKRHR